MIRSHYKVLVNIQALHERQTPYQYAMHAKCPLFAMLSFRHLRRSIHANITALHFTQILQEEAAFEISVGMQDGIELTRWP